MIMGKKVVIVVPLYRTTIDELEEISLTQLFRVLGKYDIFFIAPKTIEKTIGKTYHERNVIYYDDYWFTSRLSYSQLCLEDGFYATFSDYQYMLIHQLDAFVFQDSLESFCDNKFDYYGAPHSLGSVKLISRVAKGDNGFYVGNGGFSLRNVERCRAVLKLKEMICHEIGEEGYFDSEEDSFFTYCGLSPRIDFCIPSIDEAVKFSLQADADFFVLKEKLKGRTPFGTHAWSKDFSFPLVKEYIDQALGIDFHHPKLNENIDIFYSLRRSSMGIYLLERIKQIFDIDYVLGIIRNRIDVKKEYVLWGYGEVGQRAYRFLSNFGINVSMIFDKNAEKYVSTKDQVNICLPNLDILEKNTSIIISSTKFSKEIASKIEEEKKGNTINVIYWIDIENEIIDDLFGDTIVDSYHRFVCSHST